jgi:hypothetical protein
MNKNNKLKIAQLFKAIATIEEIADKLRQTL